MADDRRVEKSFVSSNTAMKLRKSREFMLKSWKLFGMVTGALRLPTDFFRNLCIDLTVLDTVWRICIIRHIGGFLKWPATFKFNVPRLSTSPSDMPFGYFLCIMLLNVSLRLPPTRLSQSDI